MRDTYENRTAKSIVATMLPELQTPARRTRAARIIAELEKHGLHITSAKHPGDEPKVQTDVGPGEGGFTNIINNVKLT